MAALVEPSVSAHHAEDASREAAGGSSATQDLSRRFEEMDFDNDGALTTPVHARLCTFCGLVCAVHAETLIACFASD